jgi:hypothetical protein
MPLLAKGHVLSPPMRFFRRFAGSVATLHSIALQLEANGPVLLGS